MSQKDKNLTKVLANNDSYFFKQETHFSSMTKNNVKIKEIQKYCKTRFNITAKSSYIAHAKELFGIPVSKANNRKGEKRLWPCPVKLQPLIKMAFIELGLLEGYPTKGIKTAPKMKKISIINKKLKQTKSNQKSMIKQIEDQKIEDIKKEFKIN